MKKLLLLDLDRTIFATDDFRGYVTSIVAEHSGKSLTTIDSLLFRYSDAKEDHLRHTNFEKLLKDLGISEQPVYSDIIKRIPKNSLLIPDALQLLEWAKQQDQYEVRILSFGQQSFQRLKLRVSPALDWIQADIVLVRKYQFIKDAYFDRPGYLIDDKPHQKLPMHWTEIHIDRATATYKLPVCGDDGTWHITTLKDAIQILA